MMIGWRRTIESEHWRVPEIIKASAKKNLRLTGYILNRWCHFQQRLLEIHSQSTECLQCSQDEHTLKLYSSTNNVDPAPVPPLQASTCIAF